MIITRSPLRISLGGGGTDLPSYYLKNGGYVVSAAINKYVYVNISRPFKPGITLKYSQIEQVLSAEEIVHPIFREVIKSMSLNPPQLEISTIADIPSGTGLGSSGSFTTALIKGLYAHLRHPIHAKELAELACLIEIEKLREPVGKQDQYIASFGGITEFTFDTNGKVTQRPLKMSQSTTINLEDNLLLFFTGISRSASDILRDQDTKSLNGDLEMTQNLDYIKDMGHKTFKFLEDGKCDEYAELLNEHWQRKRSRTPGMTTSQIDDWYNLGMKNGALGGKLVGAGGGGFLLFYASDREKLRETMIKAGLEELRFNFDFEGTKVILN